VGSGRTLDRTVCSKKRFPQRQTGTFSPAHDSSNKLGTWNEGSIADHNLIGSHVATSTLIVSCSNEVCGVLRDSLRNSVFPQLASLICWNAACFNNIDVSVLGMKTEELEL
jgi:hypothetical protein